MHAQVGGNLERIRVRTTLCGDRTEQLDKIYKGNERLIGDTGFLMLRILLFFGGGHSNIITFLAPLCPLIHSTMGMLELPLIDEWEGEVQCFPVSLSLVSRLPRENFLLCISMS